MITRALQWMVLTASLAAPYAAQPALRAVEEAYEVTPAQVQLPPRSEGRLTVRPCEGCAVLALEVTAASTWIVRPVEAPTDRDSFAKAMRDALLNPRARVVVFRQAGTRRVTRIVLSTPRS